MRLLSCTLLLAASALLIPAQVYAEVDNVRGTGDTRVRACSKAKEYGRLRHTSKFSTVVRFGACDCVKRKGRGAGYLCSVDVHYRRK